MPGAASVKTVKEQRLTLCIVRQLVGCALLANKFGIDRSISIRKIGRLGAYYSRAGYLHEFGLRDAIDHKDEEPVLRFFTTGGIEPLKSAS